MTDIHQKKEIKVESNAVSPVVAGIAGAVAGGIAVAAAMVMSDKKNQKKVSDAIVGAKEKVTDYMDSIKTQPVVEKSVHKAETVINDAKKRMEAKV